MEYALILILLHTLTGKVSSSNEGLTCSFEKNFCGWINDEWQRKTKSGFTTTGPSAADDGTYYIQINTSKLEHFSTIKTPYQRTSGTSCLEFKYHLYGQHVEHLSYGYYTDTNNYQEVNKISSRENHWHCATFDLSILPESAKGIYFQGKSGINQFSIIGLDSFTYNTGNDCSKCPVPPTKTTTIVPSTTTETSTPSAAIHDDKWIIIGGSCGGLVILVIIIVTVCIIKMRKRRSKQFLSKTTSPEMRALPPIPSDNNESTVPSIAGSYQRKFSVNPTHPETNDFSKSSTEGTDHEYHSIIEETKPYDYGYVDLPPDYNINENEPFDKDKSSNNSEQDSDYLEPSVGLNSGNQYESDPTENGKLKSTVLKNNQEPSVHHIEIPAIPVMMKTKVLHTSCNEIEIDDDYDDAIAATTTDGNSQNSEDSDKGSNTEENDKDDYLNVTDDDDYITPTST